MRLPKLLIGTAIVFASNHLANAWVKVFGKARPEDAAGLKEDIARVSQAIKNEWRQRGVFYARREQFDEWRFRRWEFQFFEPRLWRWGWRWSPQVGYTHADPHDSSSPVIRPVPKGWALALPTLSIRKF